MATAGYLIWTKDGKGNKWPHVHDMQKRPSDKRETAYWFLSEHPLTEDEIRLSLDELAKKYPAP